MLNAVKTENERMRKKRMNKWQISLNHETSHNAWHTIRIKFAVVLLIVFGQNVAIIFGIRSGISDWSGIDFEMATQQWLNKFDLEIRKKMNTRNEVMPTGNLILDIWTNYHDLSLPVRLQLTYDNNNSYHNNQ